MDKILFETKHTTLYFSTLQIGMGIEYVPDNKDLVIQLILLELHIYLRKWGLG